MLALREHFEPQDLHPELERHLTNLGGFVGEGIRHPLVYSAPHLAALNKMVNAQYLAKVAGVQAAMERGDWSRYIFLHERPWRFNALDDLWAAVTSPQERAALFIEVWTDSENLWQTRELWEGMVEEVATHHFHAAMGEEDRAVLASMVFPLQVFRGGDPDYDQGLSYSIDRGRAEWFAHRFERGGEVYELTLESTDDILFYSGDRGESEVVVHPNFLD